VAISNADSATTADISLDLTTLDGTSTGMHGTVTIPSGGQLARFVNQIPGFESLATPFQGVLRISASNPVTITALRVRYNERGEVLAAMAPTVNEADSYFEAALRYSDFVFPIFADGGGYTTQFILYSGWTPGSSSGTLEFRTIAGTPYLLTVH
jgi:hypothetical protein